MSPVAVQCLSILERQRVYDEARDDVEREMLAIKTGLLGREGVSAEKLFPRYFLPSPSSEAEDLENREQQDIPTPDEVEDIERWLAEKGGVITGAELEDDGWQ